MNAPSGYKWIGRKIRHAHAPVGPVVDYDNESMFFTANEALDGSPIRDSVQDVMSCKGGCGFHVCAKRGPCAPKPKDELPTDRELSPDWRMLRDRGFNGRPIFEAFGAKVYFGSDGEWCSTACPQEGFASATAAMARSEDFWDERAEAAALASVEPESGECLWCGQHGATIKQTSGRFICSDYAGCRGREAEKPTGYGAQPPVGSVMRVGKPAEPKCIECGHRQSLHPNPISAHAFEARPPGCDCLHGYSCGCAVHDKAEEPELRPGWSKGDPSESPYEWYRHTSGAEVWCSNADLGYWGWAARPDGECRVGDNTFDRKSAMVRAERAVAERGAR